MFERFSFSSNNEASPLEKCKLGNTVIDIPQELCEQRTLFNEVVSLETWEKVLSSEQRNHLMKFLPTFPESDAINKRQVVRSLFARENFKFGNPLNQFHKKLKEGTYTPEMTAMTAVLQQAKRQDYLYRQQRYYNKLLQEILISRKNLLDAAEHFPADQPIRLERLPPKPSLNTVEQRTKKRYMRELQEVREEVGELDTSSEDENYPEGLPLKCTRRSKKQSQSEATLNPTVVAVYGTLAPKPQQIAPGSGSNAPARCSSPFDMSEDSYHEMLLRHKRRRLEKKSHPELDTSGISLRDIGARTNLPKRPTAKPASTSEAPTKRKAARDRERSERKKQTQAPSVIPLEEPFVVPTPPVIKVEPDTGHADPPTDPIVMQHIKLEPPSPPPLEPDLDDPFPEAESELRVDVGDGGGADSGVDDVSSLVQTEGGIELDQEMKFALPKPASPVVPQGLYESFFSLLRELFLESPEYKLSQTQLEEKVQVWQESPFSGLNEWFSKECSWTELLQSALKFLSGQTCISFPDNFSPYVSYREKNIWLWAGDERDCDTALTALFYQWLDTRQDDDLNVDSFDTIPGSPPPPRVHTLWAVQPTTDDEKSAYRTQERERYENPHRASTFTMHGYDAVVGPVKGVYGKDSAMNKAREHSLLISDRPPFVTILSLVRDAAARLPNGEGTRADICELLRDSQFLAPAADSQIHTVVSGALDRLHYEKDPCVKYDVNRKTWIYLHRNRSEEEYERVHRAQATAAKTKKVVQKTKVKQTKSKSASRPTPTSDSQMVVDVLNTSGVSSVLPITPTITVPDTSMTKTPSISHRAKSNQPSKLKSHASHKQSALKQPSASMSSSTVFHSLGETVTTSAVPVLARSNSVPVTLTTSKLDSADALLPSATLSVSGPTLASASFIVTQTTGSSNVANVMPSQKAIISSISPAQLINIAQLQLMKSGPGSSSSGGPIVVVTTAPTIAAKVAPPKTVGAIMAQQAAAAAARAVTVNTQAIGTVKLVPSGGPPQTQTIASLTGKPLVAASVMASHPQQQTSLKGMQTIVHIQQEAVPSTMPISHHVTKMTAMPVAPKPVVPRIISPPQVVSVGNLIASSLAASQKQGNPMQGTTTTIKIQGSNLIRPIGGAHQTHLNVIQASAAATPLGTQGSLSRLTLVTQGNTTSLIPVSGPTVTSQPKLLAAATGPFGIVTSQLTTHQAQVSTVTKPTILSTPGGIKIMSAPQGTPGTVSLAQLTGKPTGQTMMLTTSTTGVRATVPSSMAVTMGAAPTVMLTTAGGGVSQRTLKPVVMAARPGLHQMQHPHQHRLPLAPSSMTSGVGPVKATLQGVKVIPVGGSATKAKSQPVFARIITPPGSLTLRPATLAPQSLGGVIHATMAHHQHHLPTLGTVRTVTAGTGAPKLAQATTTTTTIIRVQNPHFPSRNLSAVVTAAPPATLHRAEHQPKEGQ